MNPKHWITPNNLSMIFEQIEINYKTKVNQMNNSSIPNNLSNKLSLTQAKPTMSSN